MVKALSLRTTQIQLYIFNYLFRLKKTFLNLDLLHFFFCHVRVFFFTSYFILLICIVIACLFWGVEETGTLAGELI